MSVEEPTQVVSAESCVNMEAVNRISKLPIVESTIETATNIYSKVKDYNTVTNWTLSTAENTVYKAVEIGKPYATPVVSHFKEPIHKVDGLLCSGLDYIEEKVPAVKLPPVEMYNGAKGYVTSGVETAKHMVEPAVGKAMGTVEVAKHIVEPAVETAKHYIDPAIETAKQYIDPAMETACAIKDYGVNKVDKFLYAEKKDAIECEECQKHDNNEEAPQKM